MARKPAAMRLAIVLPEIPASPTGGYQVAYRYANEFAALGHRVTVVQALRDRRPARSEVRTDGRAVFDAWRHGFSPGWFELRPDVRTRIVPWLRPEVLPRADVTLLTAWQTSLAIRRPPLGGGVLAQLVADYEIWARVDTEERLKIEAALGRDDVLQVACSTAVKRMLSAMGRPDAPLVVNRADLARWGTDAPVEGREPVIAFAARDDPHKGVPYLLEALEALKAQRPELRAVCFGYSQAPVPEWVEHRGRVTDAELRALYNECSIFVLPSDYEGYGLPASEAMLCGAALVTTANGGSEDYAIDGATARVVPIKDPLALETTIAELLDDEPQRVALARAGRDLIASGGSWDVAARELLAAIS